MDWARLLARRAPAVHVAAVAAARAAPPLDICSSLAREESMQAVSAQHWDSAKCRHDPAHFVTQGSFLMSLIMRRRCDFVGVVFFHVPCMDGAQPARARCALTLSRSRAQQAHALRSERAISRWTARALRSVSAGLVLALGGVERGVPRVRFWARLSSEGGEGQEPPLPLRGRFGLV